MTTAFFTQTRVHQVFLLPDRTLRYSVPFLVLNSRQQQNLAKTDCPIAWDQLTRSLYATDASIYQITPAAVAFPRNTTQAAQLIQTAANEGLSLTPRGAGTGLVGGAIGEGLVIDFSRFNCQISELNPDARTVRVGAGVVLDNLNTYLRHYGLCFGPDVATSSRATLGGMIANDSSGAHVPVYGTTADHIRALELVLANGEVAHVSDGRNDLPAQTKLVTDLVDSQVSFLQTQFHPGITKRWPGYGFARWLRHPGNLNDIIAGSEGTLAGIMSAVLNLVPLPRQKGLALFFFQSVEDAMQATVELLDLRPAAIEHIDRILFDQTKGQLSFQPARDLLELDERPCAAILMVEFYEDVAERLQLLAKRRLGQRQLILTDPAAMNLVWALRKAGLSILTGRKGPAKPVTCIEDTAVRPEQLPAYVAGLRSILEPLGVQTCYYGHAASGLLHVRPVLDLHKAQGVQLLRTITTEVAALVRQFKGSFAAEHGVGIARTEFLAAHLGPELISMHRAVKSAFDPGDRFNPGKLIDNGRFKVDRDLRLGIGYELKLPFEPVLAFTARDESFLANLEQCNGCGGCRKSTPTMCPTYSATGEEAMSTRGRANLVRAVLEGRLSSAKEWWSHPAIDLALSNCLACKACTTECPSNVNLSLLKTELLHARHREHGLTWRELVLSSVDQLGAMASYAPAIPNGALQSPLIRWILQRTLGISTRRALPLYARERFDRWFRQRARRSDSARPQVILWDDTFVRYYDPHVGIAATTVLERAGFDVLLAQGRKCCGRPAFSQGNLDRVRTLGTHNLALLHHDSRYAGLPLVFLEPSCWSMFKEDYRELRLPHADAIAPRAFLFEDFIERTLQQDPAALQFAPREETVALHAHCHTKALANPGTAARLARRLPGRQVTLLETGCCGMAGAFGTLESKYELSRQIAAPLLEQLQRQSPGTRVIASGTSCRHQIADLARVAPQHLAELLADALDT